MRNTHTHKNQIKVLIINSQRRARKTHRAGVNRGGKLKRSDTGAGSFFSPSPFKHMQMRSVLLNCIIYVDNSGIIITATQIKLHHN